MSIRCAHCKTTGPGRHETVAEVQECADWQHYVESGQAEADQLAEIRAEQGYERWLEDGGPHAAQIQWENEQDRLMHPFDLQAYPENAI